MKTKEAIENKIEKIMKEYHKKKRNIQEWITTTYTVQTLRWVIEDLETMPIDDAL